MAMNIPTPNLDRINKTYLRNLGKYHYPDSKIRTGIECDLEDRVALYFYDDDNDFVTAFFEDDTKEELQEKLDYIQEYTLIRSLHSDTQRIGQ